jgi:CRP-like cAMP-binding protein
MTTRTEVVGLTDGMPERRLAPGELLFDQGADGGRAVAVLVEGSLEIDLDGMVIDRVTIPGAFVGEIGALLGAARTARVRSDEGFFFNDTATTESFFATHPQLALELARQLAGRLQRILAYLADIREQYADAEGHLGMVDAVLGRMSARPPIDIDPGSDRSPDY